MNQPDWQPVLEGELTALRPVSAGDWDEMFRAGSDPLIWQGHPSSDRYKEQVFRNYFDDAIASGSALTILNRANGAIIGCSRYHGYDPALSEVEIGWTFLSREHWGGIYNREMKDLMLDHAFDFVDSVVFWVAETNIRSRRAMEKIGGHLRPGTVVRTQSGDDCPYVVYEIRKADRRRA